MDKWLTWNDLTEEEKDEAKETYIGIREHEEDRSRNDVTSNPDYPNPITSEGVENCKFKRVKYGYIYVII